LRSCSTDLLPQTLRTHSQQTDLPIDCSAPTKEEIQNAIKQLRNGKAAGPDNSQQRH